MSGGITLERENVLKSVNVRYDSSGNNVGVRQKDFSIEDLNEEDLEENNGNIGLDYFTNENKRIQESDTSSESNPEGSETSDVMMGQRFAEEEQQSRAPEGMSYEEIQHKKAFFLSKLKRLQNKGHETSRRLGPEHSLEEIQNEVMRIDKEIEIDNGINYCKKGLMFFVTTIEMLNTKFDPVGAKLDGWSNLVMSEQDNYEDVFEELYEKYSTKIQMGPEIKLISMIAGSAFMFNLQKSLVDKAMNSNDILGSINNLMKKKGQEPQEMRGPSTDTDDLLRKLASSSDVSDVSSILSDSDAEEIKVVSVPIKKKAGRPRKQK